MDRGAEFRVPHRTERESEVLRDNSNLTDVMRWLGDTSQSAFKTRQASPAAFVIAIPQWPIADVRRGDKIAYFFNWIVRFKFGKVTHVEDWDVLRDPKTGKNVINSDGETVRDEMWERKATVKITLYNHGDAHFTGAREFVQARESNEFKFKFTNYERQILPPSDIDAGVTEEDAEVLLEAWSRMPDLKFEQQDESGAFLPLGSAKYVTIPADEDATPRQVITSHHRYMAFWAATKKGIPSGPARDFVNEHFKDAYAFNALDAEPAGNDEPATLEDADLYIDGDDFDAGDFSAYSLHYHNPPPTRRRGPPPSSKPGEEKRPKIESKMAALHLARTPQTKCSFCNRRKAVAACDGCGEAKYCGEQCQKIAWHFDGHHKTCVPKK